MPDHDRHAGDGVDNYADAAHKTADAVSRFQQASVQKSAAAGAEAAAKGAEASANAAAAAVKTGIESGKAVSGMAAGAAASGPWGPIIAAALAAKNTLYKVLICLCLFLLFIIILIVLLPTIVFNSAFRIDLSTIPISAPTDVFSVFEDLSDAISGCVTSGYYYALAEVDRIIVDGGYDYGLSMEALTDHGLDSTDYDVCYIIAAYCVSMQQTGASSADLCSKLNAMAALMFPVTYTIRQTTVTVPPQTTGGKPVTMTVEYVEATIHPFNASIILNAFGVDPDAQYGQFNVSCGDAIEDMATALKRTIYGVTASGMVPQITDTELQAFLAGMTCSPARKELIRVGLSLVGRVPYFWGGKSPAGWNNAWNTPRLVTSAGSGTTGTIRPFGLDCSGFTDWVYKTALGQGLRTGSWSQWDNSYEIADDELLPGDLGFKDRPGNGINHVLIYAGTDPTGKMLWVHCTASGGGVVLDSPNIVRYYRRVADIDLDSMAVPVP